MQWFSVFDGWEGAGCIYVIQPVCQPEIPSGPEGRVAGLYQIHNGICARQGYECSPSELEICRFKLREGARLRINYKDFFDIQTEYDTVNLADAVWAARDGNTLSKYITDYFAERVLECDRAQEGDVEFARMLLQSRDAVPRMILDDYIGRKTGNRNRKGPFMGRESFHRLEDILEGIRNGTGSRGSGKRADNERMIILD